ncbi:MAG: SusD/RagB family nutrient-binding outer membrane lipoprotein [Bacteroidales bacterium]|nr:SusD/RagB family nutrient-binding outer membrane lipoprotein [Bacteroidales bacterium]
MKKVKIITAIFSLMVFLAIIVGCTKDFEKINTDPNNSVAVETGYLLTFAQKNIMDNIRDVWFGGRTTQVLAQHWSQRNYTDEDRYLFRTTVINNAWRVFYRTMMNLEEIIRLNTNEATKDQALASGPNKHQIAVAKILQVYLMSIITDTWGDAPYSEALKGNQILQPKYDKQEDVYKKMIDELKAASTMINPADGNLTIGDIIYNGDMTKWKKFANSLRLRLALRVKTKNPTYLAEAIALPASSFFESNQDNAVFKYLNAAPNQGPVYRAFFVDARNDFTIAKPFVELLAGRNDTLNAGKNNPFFGITDPRIAIWSYRNNDLTSPYFGRYIGMPYGMLETNAKQFSQHCPDYFNNPSIVHKADFGYTYMDYAEVCFIFSEANAWNQTWYTKGVRASMEFWGVPTAQINTHIASIGSANAEKVMTQKYIALYMQPEQAWFEYRRMDFPKMLIKPGEITHRIYNAAGVPQNLVFEALEGTAIPRRLQYPVEELGVNKTGYDGAIVSQGQDLMSTKVWWDK